MTETFEMFASLYMKLLILSAFLILHNRMKVAKLKLTPRMITAMDIINDIMSTTNGT